MPNFEVDYKWRYGEDDSHETEYDTEYDIEAETVRDAVLVFLNEYNPGDTIEFDTRLDDEDLELFFSPSMWADYPDDVVTVGDAIDGWLNQRLIEHKFSKTREAMGLEFECYERLYALQAVNICTSFACPTGERIPADLWNRLLLEAQYGDTRSELGEKPLAIMLREWMKKPL